ncbi:type III secretion protein [Pseudomonas entomophila]|uniref:type III secretion protein n=1 Tax=Pseudomonas entomophila TaxID=312306 RepID=UPI0023D7BA4C|nr:type III secretion protein [Pseudomonas entomophila]MDF0733068.1 type III secretion protein [Pseudomonas entomophila]
MSLEHWQALLAQPLAFIDPRHLRTCFADDVLPARIQALATAPRFQARLLALLMREQQLQPLAQVPAPATADLPVLLLAPDAFARLPRLCGAIWHGAALGREIRREAVERLRQALGHEVFNLALAHRQWSGAMDLLRQPDDLLTAIDADGARSVHAWLQAQPDALRDWLRLRLPLPPVEPFSATLDPGLVRRVAGLLAKPLEEVTP